MLPLNPTDADHGHSPYTGTSAFTGNPLLISPHPPMEQGLLSCSELCPAEKAPVVRAGTFSSLAPRLNVLIHMKEVFRIVLSFDPS
jgi:4-alpha-glucanotransferase